MEIFYYFYLSGVGISLGIQLVLKLNNTTTCGVKGQQTQNIAETFLEILRNISRKVWEISVK